jgi:hypothetical protein
VPPGGERVGGQCQRLGRVPLHRGARGGVDDLAVDLQQAGLDREVQAARVHRHRPTPNRAEEALSATTSGSVNRKSLYLESMTS